MSNPGADLERANLQLSKSAFFTAKVLLVVELASAKVRYFSRLFLLRPLLYSVVSRLFWVLRSCWLLDSAILTKYLKTASSPVQIRLVVGKLLLLKVLQILLSFPRSVPGLPSLFGNISLSFCPLRSKIEPVVSGSNVVDETYRLWPIQAGCWVTIWSSRQGTRISPVSYTHLTLPTILLV